MPLDTLAFTKHLEREGVDRRIAEAHAVAISRYLFSDVATKADLTELRRGIENRLTSIDARLDSPWGSFVNDMTIRMIIIFAAMDALLFTALRLTAP